MSTATKKLRIAAFLLALAVGLLVREGRKSAGTEDQSSVVNLVRAVGHLNFRRALKAHSNVTASNSKKANLQTAAVNTPQEANLDTPQEANLDQPAENAALSDSRPRNETRSNPGVGLQATGKEAEDEHWILFLLLRMRNDTVELISSSRSPGVLKAARKGQKVGPIDYDVVTATGESIWSDNIEDPLIERMEFPPAENTVELPKTYFKRSEVEFTLRVPWKREACQLQFYRRQLIESPAGQRVDRRPLSSLTLPSYERSTL